MKQKCLKLTVLLAILALALPLIVQVTHADETTTDWSVSGEITINTNTADVSDVLHINGDSEGHQYSRTGSTYIERWANFWDGELYVSSHADEAQLSLDAYGEDGYLNQMAPLHGYYHGCTFTNTLNTYDDFVIGAEGEEFGVSTWAGFDNEGAWFGSMIQGEGQGELRGISFTAQDRYGYNWIYGGNNKQWQPLSGDAEGTGKFLLTSGGNKGLNFDFNWYNGAISGQVVVNGSGASEILMSGTFNSEFGYRGTVRAYENP